MINKYSYFFKDFSIVFLGMLLTTFSGMLFIGNKGFAMDEIATLSFTKNWPTMLHIIKFEEANMWLYYFLVYFWQFFGHSESFVRLLSVLFTVGTVPFVYYIGKELFSKKAAIITVILFSLHVFVVSNAQNARSYSMVLFFTTLSSYYVTKYIFQGSKKYLFLSALVNVAAIYSHIYVFFIIGAQLLSVILLTTKNMWKQIIPSLLLIIILSLPFLFAPSIHASQVAWIEKPTIRNLIGTFLVLSDDFPVVAGLYVVLFADTFLSVLIKRRKMTNEKLRKQIFVLLWLLFPIIASFLFSSFVKPLYTSTYFFVCLVPFTLLVAYSIDKIKLQWIKIIFIISIIILSTVRLYGWYAKSKAIGFVINNYHEDFKGTALFLTAHASSTDVVMFLPPYAQQEVNFYLPGETKTSMLHEITPQQLSTRYPRIWYVLQTVTDKKTDREDKIIKNILVKQYTLKKFYKLDAMTIYEYEKDYEK